MTQSLPANTPSNRPANAFSAIRAPKDVDFDMIYPLAIRKQSITHWSPVNVCRMAAQLLAQRPGTRVLDIGCGPGKFCAIGATTTEGFFTGVEQRERLVKAARDVMRQHQIDRVEIIHGNILDVNFRHYDAFYLFNPFQENILSPLRIDYDVDLDPRFYASYTTHVQQQLLRMPMGTRVVTYCGDCMEIPNAYACTQTAFNDRLKLWVKKHASPEYARLSSADEDHTNQPPLVLSGGLCPA